MENKKVIIIFSQGRSGSTLLQRILHCVIPDAHFTGENDNFWYHLFRGYISLRESHKMQEMDPQTGTPLLYEKSDPYKPAWYNILSQQELLSEYRRLFFRMHCANDSRVTGFKEIRFPHAYDEFVEYLDFFRLLFPHILYIFTVRNLDDVVRSGWWTESDRTHLQQLEDLFATYHNTNPSSSFIVHYEDMLSHIAMTKLFDFLGESLVHDDYARVIARRYV